MISVKRGNAIQNFERDFPIRGSMQQAIRTLQKGHARHPQFFIFFNCFIKRKGTHQT